MDQAGKSQGDATAKGEFKLSVYSHDICLNVNKSVRLSLVFTLCSRFHLLQEREELKNGQNEVKEEKERIR